MILFKNREKPVCRGSEVCSSLTIDGKFNLLIATNVCARGVDIPEVDLVVNCEPPQDVETYVHRSGRTGRAGRSGTAVTFYKPQQERLLNNISRSAGVDFIRIGAPQPEDIIKARARDAVETIKTEVDPTVFKYFTKTSAEIIESFEGDAAKAVGACLALICQTVKPIPTRMLFSNNQDLCSRQMKDFLLFTSKHLIRSPLRPMYDRLFKESMLEFFMMILKVGE